MFVGVEIVGIKSEGEGLVIKKAIDDSVKALFPNSNLTILIDVEVEDLGDTFALVDQMDDDLFAIILDKQALEDDCTLYKTVCHEMVHIKQYIEKELVHINQYRTMWKNKVYDHFTTPYEKRPWELEAYQKEEEIYKCFESNH